MKILLAGQNGIIGSFLYEELKSANEITGIGKGELNSLNYIDLDLLNREQVNEVFAWVEGDCKLEIKAKTDRRKQPDRRADDDRIYNDCGPHCYCGHSCFALVRRTDKRAFYQYEEHDRERNRIGIRIKRELSMPGKAARPSCGVEKNGFSYRYYPHSCFGLLRRFRYLLQKNI